jgi:short-subunit dehydrogenase
MMKAATPVMIAQGSGRIINMISLGAEIGFPYSASYSASKFALAGYSEALRMELKPTGVTVSLISPAGVNTGTLDIAVTRAAGTGTHPIFGKTSEAIVLNLRTPDPKAQSPMLSVAQAVESVIKAKNPKLLYRVGFFSKLLSYFKRNWSQSGFENFFMGTYGNGHLPTKPTKA